MRKQRGSHWSNLATIRFENPVISFPLFLIYSDDVGIYALTFERTRIISK